MHFKDNEGICAGQQLGVDWLQIWTHEGRICSMGCLVLGCAGVFWRVGFGSRKWCGATAE